MKVGRCDTTNPGQTHDADCDCSRYRREVAGEIVGDLRQLADDWAFAFAKGIRPAADHIARKYGVTAPAKEETT